MKKRKFSPILGGRFAVTPSSNWRDPDSFDDMGTKLSDEEVMLTVPIDDIFEVDSDTVLSVADESRLDWATQDKDADEDWYVDIDGYDVAIRDSQEIIEDALTVLEDNVPYKQGKYHITCKVNLVYRVSGVVTWNYQTGPSYHSDRYDEDFADYDSGVDTEDIKVELMFGKCYVSNLEIESIK